ncbi:hypothetical protein [Arthrobacter sp. C152]
MTQPALFKAPKKAPKKPGQDDWLKQLLETKTGGFRAARWQRCPTCDQITLHGMDADIAAGMATVDPTPLSPLQELACFIVGRDTYVLKPREKGYELSDRSGAYLYGPRPPDHGSKTIVPAHQCGARFPGFIPRPNNQETTNEPDF